MAIDKINQFCSQIDDEFPNLNAGGCAVFAAHMAKRLQHHLPSKIAIFNIVPFEESIDEIRQKVKNRNSAVEWFRNGMDFCHVMVEVDYSGDTHLFDSKRMMVNCEKFELVRDVTVYKTAGRMHIEEMCALAANRFAWCDVFDRRDIPKLRRRMDSFFKSFKVG